MKLASIKTFAINVGYVSTKVRSAADPFHAAYNDATPEQRKALRHDWMLGHLEGQGVSNPERVLSHGKAKGAKPEHIKAIDRASSDFRYMVVRPDVAVKAEAKAMRLSKDVRKAAEAYLANFESVADAIKALRAL